MLKVGFTPPPTKKKFTWKHDGKFLKRRTSAFSKCQESAQKDVQLYLENFWKIMLSNSMKNPGRVCGILDQSRPQREQMGAGVDSGTKNGKFLNHS